MWQLASSLSTNYNVSSTVRLEWSSVDTVETQDHVTPLLRDKLHWLRARERITFKLCLLVYKAINGLAPSYLQDLCVPVTTVSTRAALRSAARGDLDSPSYQMTSRHPGICIAAPTAWNSLPPDIWTASSVTTFKNGVRSCMAALVVTLWSCYGTL